MSITVYPNLLYCIAVCCSVLQCVAVCCSVLQCVAECSSVLDSSDVEPRLSKSAAACCNVLQCVAVFCSVLRWGWVFLERTRILSGIQSERGFSVESQRISSKFLLWKRNDSSVVL